MRKLSEAAAGFLPGVRPERVTKLGSVAGFVANEWGALMARLSEHLEKEEIN